MSKIEEEIQELKKSRDAIVLAHFYQSDEIQDVADAVGDSLFLAQKGFESKAKVVVLAGVVFMAESVKLLSPEKIVLVPDLEAGCSLVSSTPDDKYREWREKYPDAIAVTYINSSATVKAMSDIICTSSNAEKIIDSIPKDKKILFGPDKNLGHWLVKKTGREMLLWQGACEVHVLFSAENLSRMKSEHPNAVVLAHPECDDAVLAYADVIGSTSKLLSEVGSNPATEFIVATEDGIFHKMRKLRPDAVLIQAPIDNTCACNRCPYMRLNSLEKIRDALKNLGPQVVLDEKLRVRARLPLERMLSVSEGRSVQFH